jgi:hypothetical protein
VSDRLSLAQVAEILGGVSTARASQILSAARAQRAQAEPPEAPRD